MAATLACGRDAVLSHRSAAELWQLQRRSGRVIEVTRATGWLGPRRVALHRGPLPADERTVVDGIPVTTVPRTIIDLAAVVPRGQLQRALNEIEVRGLVDVLSIADLLRRYPRRPGTAVVRELLADESATRGVPDQRLEERFLAVLEAHDLPRPRLNADLSVRNRFFRPDCLWAKRRLIVELDGRASHGTARAFEKDRERDRLLLTDGWQVMRVTWRQLDREEPQVVADLRRVLAETRPAPGS
jgi:very-short-patch-repair endonuclease